MNDITMSASQWRELCRRVFSAWGAPEDIAACVANSLVESDLAGVYSHGVVRIGNYYNFVKPGWWHPDNRAEVVRESAAMALIDGHWGFGQPAVHMGLQLGIEKAKAQGIAGVGITRTGHIGRLGEYVEKAAEAGLIALMGVNNGKNGGWVTPYGGMERVFSTNPIAAAVPARKHPHFMMDFATTVVAAGKLELSPDRDMKIPEGWAIDNQGKPATTARAYMEGGAMLPFGGHKGYALLLLVELLCGALTGAGVAKEPTKPPAEGAGGNATFIVLLDIPHFTDVDQFYGDVDGLFDRLKQVKPAAGFKKVIIPGEPEAEQRAKKSGEGITIVGPIWERIQAIAAEGNVNLDGIM